MMSKATSSENAKPNILFLLSDEHSFRFLGHVGRERGGEKVETPYLDSLAAQSAVFSNTYCAVPLCVPSRMSLMTGLEAIRVGAWDNQSILDPHFDTIPKRLGRLGYTTCAVGKMHFVGDCQFHGFQHRPYGDFAGQASHQPENTLWMGISAVTGGAASTSEYRFIDDIEERTYGAGVTRIPESQITDRVVATETVAFLRDHQQRSPDKAWFLCASFSRPHFPMTAPPRFTARYPTDQISGPFVPASGASYDHPVSAAIRRGFLSDRISIDEMMHARAGYFACVSYLDEILGDLLRDLEASGLLDNTVIVYASDHGEMAGEHGTWWKSGWYEACTRVPMFISTPAHRSGTLAARRIDQPASLLDVMPTLAALAGADADDDLSGIDLTPLMHGKQAGADRIISCDHLNPRWGPGTEFRAALLGKYKYVHFRDFDPLFFDLATDPGEQHNLAGEAQGDARAAFLRLHSHVLERLDFAAVDAGLKITQPQLKAQYALARRAGTPNQYVLPEGLLIDAETTLYAARIVSRRPHAEILDWPKNSN